jgi:hypothetical protein
MEETKRATEHGTDDEALWEDSCKELSDYDLGHIGSRNRQYTIPADRI